KTALRYTALGLPGATEPPPALTPQRVSDLAASFQEAVVDVLIGKCRQALARSGRKTLCLGGGVAANLRLRERLEELRQQSGIDVVTAPLSLCTDNAAMGAIGWELLRAEKVASLDVDVTPGLVRHSR